MSDAGRRPIMFATNYPMAEARRLWRAGEYSGYHLFGTQYLLDDGWPVVDLPATPAGGGRLRSKARFVAGNVGAQGTIWRRRGERPIAYGADPVAFGGLALLRAAGLWRHPVIAIAHPEVLRSRLALRTLRSYDVVIALSKRIHHELVHEVGRPAARTLWGPPGPDIDCPLYVATGADVVVSSGKTLRDETTLLAALAELDIPARVHTLGHLGVRTNGRVDHVGTATYPEVAADLRRASVVAIPLTQPTGTYGITELNDALGLAKPIVQTRNPYLDVDLPGIGAGYFVEPGDVAGWRAALSELHADPARAAEMGQRGREFAEQSWNTSHFAEVVRAAIELVS